MENNDNLMDMKDDDLKFKPLKVQNPFSGGGSDWFPLVNLDSPNINKFINNFIFGFSTPVVPGKIDDNFYENIGYPNDNQNYIKGSELTLGDNLPEYNQSNIGYNQPGYNQGNMEYDQAGYNQGNIGYSQPGYNQGNMEYDQAGYNQGNIGYSQPGYNQGNMEYDQAGYNQGNMGYNQPGYNQGNMGYNQPGYNQGNIGYNQPGYNQGNMGYNQPEYNQGNMGYNQPGYNQPSIGYNQSEQSYQQYPKEAYGEEMISYEKGYINELNNNLNENLDRLENIEDLPHIKMLKEYDFLDITEGNLRDSNKEKINDIFSRMESSDNSILNAFKLYDIPYPMAAIIIKKIINDALDYK